MEEVGNSWVCPVFSGFVDINSWFCQVLLWILGITQKKKDRSSQVAVVSDRGSVPLELQQRALLSCATALPHLLPFAYMWHDKEKSEGSDKHPFNVFVFSGLDQASAE